MDAFLMQPLIKAAVWWIFLRHHAGWLNRSDMFVHLCVCVCVWMYVTVRDREREIARCFWWCTYADSSLFTGVERLGSLSCHGGNMSLCRLVARSPRVHLSTWRRRDILRATNEQLETDVVITSNELTACLLGRSVDRCRQIRSPMDVI